MSRETDALAAVYRLILDKRKEKPILKEASMLGTGAHVEPELKGLVDE